MRRARRSVGRIGVRTRTLPWNKMEAITRTSQSRLPRIRNKLPAMTRWSQSTMRKNLDSLRTRMERKRKRGIGATRRKRRTP